MILLSVIVIYIGLVYPVRSPDQLLKDQPGLLVAFNSIISGFNAEIIKSQNILKSAMEKALRIKNKFKG